MDDPIITNLQKSTRFFQGPNILRVGCDCEQCKQCLKDIMVKILNTTLILNIWSIVQRL